MLRAQKEGGTQCWGGSEPLGAAFGGNGEQWECSSPCPWFVLPSVRREGTRAELVVEEEGGFWHRTELWAGLSAASNWIHFPAQEWKWGQALAHVWELLMSVQLLPLRAAHPPFGEPQSGLQTVPGCCPCSSPQQWDEIIIPTL